MSDDDAAENKRGEWRGGAKQDAQQFDASAANQKTIRDNRLSGIVDESRK